MSEFHLGVDLCIFNHPTGWPIGHFFLPGGCVCFPDDVEQLLCEHHVYECTDLAGIYEIIYWGA